MHGPDHEVYACKIFKKIVTTIDDLVKGLHIKQRTI